MKWELEGNAKIVEGPVPVERDTPIISQSAPPDPVVLIPATHTVPIHILFADVSAEDRHDARVIDEVRAEIKEQGTIPLDDLKKHLDI